MAATRAGSDRAFERLYRRYQRRIAAYVHGMVNDHGRAEDITQEVFMSALRRMRETDRQIIFKPWVYEIAKNACIDAFRRSRRAEEISYDAEDGLGSADYGRLVSRSPSPDAAVDTRMSLDHLRGAFGGLSETHHDILVMRELEGLSYREIGERLGMSRPSVESTLFRARRRLTEEYEELTSGERCRRVEELIADSGGRRMGLRDERKMARHVSYCQPCRRAAFAAGFDLAALAARKSLGAKVAALLPVPAFVKRRWLGLGEDGGAGSGAAGGSPTLSSLSTSMAQYVEPLSGGWSKAAAVVVTVAVAGAGVATTKGDPAPPPTVAPPVSAVAPVSPNAARAKAAHGFAGAGATTGQRGQSAGDRRAAAPGSSRANPRRGAARRDGSAGGGGGAGATGAGSGAGHGTATGGAGAGGGSAPPNAAAGSGSNASGGGSAIGDTAKKLVPKPSGSGTVSAPSVSTPKVPPVSTGSGAVDTVTNTAGGVVDKTTGAVGGAVNKPTGAAGGAVNDATGAATGAASHATGAITGAGNQSAGAATGAVSPATGAVTGAVNQASGAATGAVDTAAGAATGAANQVTGALKQASGAASPTPAASPAAPVVSSAAGAATGAVRTASGAATGTATTATTATTDATSAAGAATSAAGAATGAVSGVLPGG
ncbi:MAG: hypothetical protein QOH46_2994 [Solirubrobacteraceae bacterium]|nr:hypothetical protein [Solirubrobacteraceae bacterium]